jgi:hypothetical protein
MSAVIVQRGFPCKITPLPTVGTHFIGTDYISTVTDTYLNYPEIFMLDYTRGSPNWTLRGWYRSGMPGPPNPASWSTLQAFWDTCEQDAPSLTDHTYVDQALAFDEVAGALNAVNICWNRNQAALEITDILLVKLA